MGGVRGNRREGANVAKIDTLKIGLALNAIGLLVSDEDFKKIRKYLDEIGEEVLRVAKEQESEGTEND